MKRNIALLFVAIVTSFVAGRPALAQEHDVQDISQKLEKVSQGLVGRMGVAAQEIGSGVSVTINGDEAFVMASTYKVAIATTLLDLVDKGQLKLTDFIDVPLETMVVGPNPITMNFVHPGVKLSVANLIEPMITESDNTATDVCLKVAGGPEAVTKMLRSIGITEQRVDRECSEILRDFYGLPDKAYATVAAAAYAKDPTLFQGNLIETLSSKRTLGTTPHQKQCWNCFWRSTAERC